MTTQEFAAKIKAKYPVYKNLSDDQLVQKMTAKYPQYKDQITGTSSQPASSLTDTLGIKGPAAGLLDFLAPSTNQLPQSFQEMQQSQAGRTGAQGDIGKSAQQALADTGDLAKTAISPALELGSFGVGGAEKAGAKVLSKVIPRFASGAMYQGAQKGSTPTSDIVSGAINTILPEIGNKIVSGQLKGAFGDAGQKIPALAQEVGQPLIGGYKKIAANMQKYTQPIRDRMKNLLETGGGLSRAEIDSVIKNTFQGDNRWLGINQDVQKWLKSEFAPIVRQAGDAHFQERMDKGLPGNHLTPPQQTLGQIQESAQRSKGLGLLADYDKASREGNTNLMNDISKQIQNMPKGSPYDAYKSTFKGVGEATGGTTAAGSESMNPTMKQKGASAGQVVRPGTPYSKRVGPSTTFTKGSRAGNWVTKEAPGSATDATHGLAPDLMKEWHQQPVFDMSGDIAQAWGDHSTPLPLNIWKEVQSNIGDSARWTPDPIGATDLALNKAKKSVYHNLKDAIISKLPKQEAHEYMKLNELASNAKKIQQRSAQIDTKQSKTVGERAGSILPYGLDAILGIGTSALTHNPVAGIAAGVGGFAAQKTGELARTPGVATATSAITSNPNVQKFITGPLQKIAGSDMSRLSHAFGM